MVNVGITILDGDVPPQNAIIEAIRARSLELGASKVYGLNLGIDGLLRREGEHELGCDEVVKDLTDRTIPINDFQCVLSTSRGKAKPKAGEEETLDARASRINETLKALGIDALFVLGGIRGIIDFAEIVPLIDSLNGRYVVIPKSMNNDIGRSIPNVTEPSPILNLGYPTAATKARYEATMAKKGSFNQNRIIVFETLGGLTGWAVSATQLRGADFVLLPEMFIDADKTVDTVVEILGTEVQRFHSQYKAVVIGIAEAVPSYDHKKESLSDEDKDKERQQLIEAYHDLAKYGDVKLKGKNRFFAERIKERLKRGGYWQTNVTGTEIAYQPRWTYPTELDIFFSRLYGQKAVDELFRGNTGTMPYISLEKLLSIDAERLMDNITITDIESSPVSRCILQPVPPKFISSVRALCVDETFLQLLYRITKTEMPIYKI